MRKSVIILSTLIVLSTVVPVSAKGVTGVEVKDDGINGNIEDFDYEISGNEIVLDSYDGKDSIIEINPFYNIDGVDYQTDLSDFHIKNTRVEVVIFNEGITAVEKAVFNSSNVKKIFFPKSMTNVYDDCLSYLHPDDGELIQIYYAGTQDEWLDIFTEYKRTKVEDAEFGEELGTAIADKINEMMGSKYDSSEFEYYFSASPDDLK